MGVGKEGGLCYSVREPGQSLVQCQVPFRLDTVKPLDEKRAQGSEWMMERSTPSMREGKQKNKQKKNTKTKAVALHR